MSLGSSGSKRKGGEVVAETLEELGIEKAFVQPGSQVLPILGHLDGRRMEVIGVVNETNGTVMADVVGRITGKPALVLVTAGPGVTNCVTGVAQAYTANSPLLLISASNPLNSPAEAFHGVADPLFQEEIFRPITKYSRTVSEPGHLREAIVEALVHSTSGRYGPSYVAVVDRLLEEELEVSPTTPLPIGVSIGVKGTPMGEIVGEINASNSPLIFAGKYVARGRVGDQVERLARSLLAPVIVPRSYPDSFPNESELYAGSIGQFDHPAASYALSTADLVINVGVRVGSSEDEALRRRCGERCRSIYVDVDNPSDLKVKGVFGDLRRILEAISEGVGMVGEAHREFRERRIRTIGEVRHRVERAVEEELGSASSGPNPLRVIRTIERALGQDHFVIGDAGAAGGVWLNDLFRFKRVGSFLHSRNYDGMGFAVPGSIGAKVASPESDVVAVTGDGSFLLGVSDLGLAKKLGVNPVIVVFNDSKFGLIWREQVETGYRPLATELPSVNVAAMAEAMGLRGVKVSSDEEFRDELDKSLSSKEGTVIEVPIKSEFPYPSRTVWRRKYF
jgi:acetolactate synthase-1/2/3 large subunit